MRSRVPLGALMRREGLSLFNDPRSGFPATCSGGGDARIDNAGLPELIRTLAGVPYAKTGWWMTVTDETRLIIEC
jgi:hypothetical protein